MNKRKYRNHYHQTRPISDLKDLVNSSAFLYSDKTAYYVKDNPRDNYRPIKFKTLKEEVDALGTAFIDIGLMGEKIAIIGENSYKWVLSYFATVNGTGVAVPLDRELRPKEIRHLIERAEVSAIVYSKKVEKTVMEATEGIEGVKHSICMSDLRELIKRGKELIENGDDRFISAKIDSDALCALLFTSGTTGLAKGVMLSHKNITSNIIRLSEFVKISENGIGLSVLPMHHSYEMTCHVMVALYQGIAVAICDGLKYIARNMSEIKATVMLGVPLIFESMHKKIWRQAEAAGKAEKMRKAIAISRKLQLYNHPALVKRIFKDVHKPTGGNVELFIAGGAAINPKVIEDLEAMGFPMIQGYGMTESAPIIAVNRDRCSKADSVGFAVRDMEVKLVNVDESGRGEIICRGPSVMLGYYDNPEDTENTLAGGWLHTGDYGYFDKEGMLYLVGRLKNVIVTKNGKNIFPEEVEFYLAERPYIMEALVHGVLDEKSGDTVVKAEIYPDYDLIKAEHGEISDQQLWNLISQEVDSANELMPFYMILKLFDIRKTEFSKTTTRKIKRYTAENFCETAKGTSELVSGEE